LAVGKGGRREKGRRGEGEEAEVEGRRRCLGRLLAVDCSVRSLIYSLLWPCVMHLIMETGVSAHTVWTKAANLFLDNKASRAMTLEAKFRALTQGNLPVLEYALSLKDLADGLTDLEQPVYDNLVLWVPCYHEINYKKL
jgi:hypothetical protein